MMVLAEFLLGLVLFLFGMSQSEDGIRQASARQLKRWIYRWTSNPLSSALCGTGVTALLQSSSMVSLIVLAFASAGVIPLYNAIGVLLGANLGTTFTGWVVTLIGFKVELDQFALPLVGIACVLQLLPVARFSINAIGKALFGLALLLFGLMTMKSSVSALPQWFDPQLLLGHSAVVYLLAGMVAAAVMQSSSAVMMIALSLLHEELISLSAAAALIIGADLGTTSTTVLGSLGQSAVKKKLAFAHVAFNLVVDGLAFLLLLPALPWLLNWVGLEDPLFSLVAFHSCFNLLGIILFLPWLRHYANWIEAHVAVEPLTTDPLQLQAMPTLVPEAALVAAEAAMRKVFYASCALNLNTLHLQSRQLAIDPELQQKLADGDSTSRSDEERYGILKQREGELLKFAYKLQLEPLAEDEVRKLDLLLEMVRSSIYSAKTLKDIRQNLADLESFEQPLLRQLAQEHKHYHQHFYSAMLQTLFQSQSLDCDYLQEREEQLLEQNDHQHRSADALVYRCAEDHDISREDLSTLFNMNHEIHHACKSLIRMTSLWRKVLLLQAEHGIDGGLNTELNEGLEEGVTRA